MINKIKNTVTIAAVLFGLAGCAAQPSVTKLLGQPEYSRHELLAGEVFGGDAVSGIDFPEERILAVNAEMRAFLHTIPAGPPTSRLNYLLNQMQSQDFSVYYDANATIPAAEVFANKRGNCMAFAAMMVAMARELGVDAYFNQVMVPPTWYLEKEQTVVYQHINMLARTERNRQVIDFNFAGYNPNYRQQQLSDNQAFAKFYSNIAMDYLAQGSFPAAYRYQHKALQLAPEDPDLWNNLGAIYRAAGYARRGAAAYQIALSFDGDNLSALSNLERALREEDNLVVAADIAERLRQYRQRNPYYWYALALKSYRSGEYDSAAEFAQDAIAIERADHRFHFLLGMARYQRGDGGYRRNFQQAMKLAGSDDNLRQYERKMQRLGEDIAPNNNPRQIRTGLDRNWWWYIVH